jgi:hypothetical protein
MLDVCLANLESSELLMKIWYARDCQEDLYIFQTP